MGCWTHAWLLAAAFCPLGCSCGAPGAVVDAGVDAGIDAGHDAGRDAGRDAGHDADRDAGPTDPGWTRLPGLPDDCNVELAVDPVAALGMRTFRACPDTGPGCRELVVDWPAREGIAPAYRFRLAGGGGYDDGAHGYIGIGRPLDADTNLFAILRDDGLPVMVRRSPRVQGGTCYGADTKINDGHILARVRLPGPPDTTVSWLGHAPVTDRVTSLAYLTSVSYLLEWVQGMGVSSAQGAFDTSGAHHIEQLGWDGTVTRVAVGLIDSPQWSLNTVVGSMTFYSGYGARNTIYAARGTTPGEVFIDPVGAEAAQIAADGRDMVWLQLYGRQHLALFDRVELWASPYAERASDVTPRMLDVMPFYRPKGDARVGWGAAVIDEDDSPMLRLYDLRSGARRTFRAVTTGVVAEEGILYVGRNEVAIAAHGTAGSDQVIRWIRRDAFE